MLKISILDMSLKITDLRLHLHLPGVNELKDTHTPVWGVNSLPGVPARHGNRNIISSGVYQEDVPCENDAVVGKLEVTS